MDLAVGLANDKPLTKDDVNLMPETLAQSYQDDAAAAAHTAATTAATAASAIPTTVHLSRRTSRKDSLAKFFRRHGPELHEFDRTAKSNSLGKVFQKRSVAHGSSHQTNMENFSTPPSKPRPRTTHSEGRKGLRGYFAQYWSHLFGKAEKRPTDVGNSSVGGEQTDEYHGERKLSGNDLMEDITGTIKESVPLAEAKMN